MVFTSEEPKESFNMAVATLMRLDYILRRMQLISETTTGIRKHRLMIEELRHFFVNATPLIGNIMPLEIINYQTRVFAVKVPTKLIRGKRMEYCSDEVDKEIMTILIELQNKIKGYFMPPARKKRMF